MFVTIVNLLLANVVSGMECLCKANSKCQRKAWCLVDKHSNCADRKPIYGASYYSKLPCKAEAPVSTVAPVTVAPVKRRDPSPLPASNADQGKYCSVHDDCSDLYYCSKERDSHSCQLKKTSGQQCQGDVRKCAKGLKCERGTLDVFSKCTVWNVKRKNGIRLYSKCSWSHFIPLRSVSRRQLRLTPEKGFENNFDFAKSFAPSVYVDEWVWDCSPQKGAIKWLSIKCLCSEYNLSNGALLISFFPDPKKKISYYEWNACSQKKI
jgi:hypothetical protein